MGDFYLYRHTSPDGKIYLGITKDPKKRWQNGEWYKKNPHFYRAIQKYGWDSFSHEILFTGLAKENACKLEIFFIRFFKSDNKEFGYNLTSGGEHFSHNQSSIRRMSENRKGKGRVKRSPETRHKMSVNHKGGAEPVKVLCVETGVVYDSIRAASIETNACKMAIARCCRKAPHYNTAGGFHWEYAA